MEHQTEGRKRVECTSSLNRLHLLLNTDKSSHGIRVALSSVTNRGERNFGR